MDASPIAADAAQPTSDPKPSDPKQGAAPASEPWEPARGTLADRIGRRSTWRPVFVGASVDVSGAIALAVVTILIGLFLTTVLLGGPLGTWDMGVSRELVETRSPLANSLTEIGSRIGDTPTVIGIAAIATIVLALRRAWAKAGYLVGALLIEVTAFLATTFAIDRDRPQVPRLDDAPVTSSFPSGHAAASLVLFVALAIIVTSSTRHLALRVIAWAIAIVVPAAVALSRVQRGMHHATDIGGSLIIAGGSLAISMLAVRAASARSEDRHEQTRSVDRPEETVR